MELVAGRECGECTVCCVALNLDTPEFQKLPQTRCTHLGPNGGCSIHASVYPVCKVYHCAWRYLKGLGEDWRPDKSGILVDFQTEGLPANYPKRPGIRLMVTGPAEALFASGCIAFLSGLVLAEVPVVLAVPGPPGHFPAGAFLNDALHEAVSTGDAARIVDALRGVIGGLAGHAFAPVVHRHKPPT